MSGQTSYEMISWSMRRRKNISFMKESLLCEKEWLYAFIYCICVIARQFVIIISYWPWLNRVASLSYGFIDTVTTQQGTFHLNFRLCLLFLPVWGVCCVHALEMSTGKIPSLEAVNGSTVLLPCTYASCIGITNLYFKWEFNDNGTMQKVIYI